ncbi:MAG: hypothetical protein FWF97_02400 [Alphaproteobacteria bacterium]|nr:hypothetical protein [Alphaproteobacteria bacterium]
MMSIITNITNKAFYTYHTSMVKITIGPFIPPTSYLLPPTSYFLPPTSYFLPPTSYFLLSTCYLKFVVLKSRNNKR